MKTLYGEPYFHLYMETTLPVPAQQRVVREQARTVQREERRCVGRVRHGVGWWAAMVVLGLVTALLPASYLLPSVYNWWPNDILRASWSRWPGPGSTVGIAAGHIFLMRGRMADATDDPGGELEGHWDLTRWYGWKNCGFGTRLWGLGKSLKHWEQRGVVVPTWLIAVPAVLMMAAMRGKGRAPREAGEDADE